MLLVDQETVNMCDHELWNELGNLYFLSGSYIHAIWAYNRAIELKPETGEPYSNLALTYVQMKKYSEAEKHYQRGIDLLKDELDKAISLHKLGEVYLHLRQFPQAADTYRKTEELVPDFGQIVDASELSDLLLHCPTTSSHLEQIRAGNASLTFESGMPPFVEELTPWWFDNQIEPGDMPEPDYDYWYMDEDGVFSVSNELVSAESVVDDLIQKEQDNAKDEQQGLDPEAVVESNDVAKSLDDFVHPAEQDKSTTEELDVLEETSKNANDESASIEAVLVSVMDSSDKLEIVTDAPEFSGEDMTSLDAVQYETPIEWPLVELSEADRSEILPEINKLKRVLEINPRNAFAWNLLGGNYKTLGQYDDAIDAYQKAVSLDSSRAFYFHHLGLVYAAVGRYEDAIHAFERVIEIDPKHSLAHATLGGYYRKNGNEELAKKHIEKARQLITNDENEYNLACMEAICGNTDHSLELLELALKNKQTYVNWALKDPDLDFIRSDPRFQVLLSEYAVKAM